MSEGIVLLDHFRVLADPRQRDKVVDSLDEVLLLCLLAVLAGAESIVDIARGEKKRELLRRFRPFAGGTPSHDQLGTILATVEAETFQQCFVSWVAAVSGAPAEVIAIDGKTSLRELQIENRRAQAFAVCVEGERAGDAASQSPAHDGVDSADAGERVANHLALDWAKCCLTRSAVTCLSRRM